MASFKPRGTLAKLPTELLLSILGHATLNSDLAALRLIDSSFNRLIIDQHRFLLQGLCSTHELPDRLLGMYFSYNAIKTNNLEALMFLSQEVFILDTLCEDGQRLIGRKQKNSNHLMTNLLWFSTFTSALKGGAGTQQSLQDVLVPSEMIDAAVPMSLCHQFKHWFQNELSLAELEAIITAINIVTSKVWSTVFLYKTQEARVNAFASLSGHTFNIEQAILTEHIIWHGPKWGARQMTIPLFGKTGSLEQRLHRSGPWLGSKEDGTRIAANGLTRLLWKERQRRLDEHPIQVLL